MWSVGRSKEHTGSGKKDGERGAGFPVLLTDGATSARVTQDRVRLQWWCLRLPAGFCRLMGQEGWHVLRSRWLDFPSEPGSLSSPHVLKWLTQLSRFVLNGQLGALKRHRRARSRSAPFDKRYEKIYLIVGPTL